MELFGLIGIKDIIDILIVATLLFYIYKIMKESGTLSIFSGCWHSLLCGLWLRCS